MSISEADLIKAREAWGAGLVDISVAFEAEGIDGARTAASRMLDDLYGYDNGPVLFKPTMASGQQTFRRTKRGALSYFVAHDSEFPLDTGFGLKGWRAVRSESGEAFIEGNVAMWMGWVTMTDKDGLDTTVDKSWGYKRDAAGIVRIVLHHSSFPYEP